MKKYELKIEQDNDPMNPRTDWDNITTMLCFHKRYDLGDKNPYKSSDFDSWEEMKQQIEQDYNVFMIKPLYLYDHSGITISTSPFGCQWDSGQVGWIFIDEKQWKLMMGEDMDRSEERLNSIIDSDVKTYDQYITGEVYRYELYEIETCSLGCEHKTMIESCGSYYSEEECESEGNSVMKDYVDSEVVM